MTAARVRRGSGARTRKPAARVAVPKKIARKLPVDQARANRLATIAFTGFLALIAVAVIFALDLPAKAARQVGLAIGNAGFEVDNYQIVGLKRMDRAVADAVVIAELKRAADESGVAMDALPQPFVDVGAIRERLLRYGWVEDARVSRRLPHSIVIDIVERKPAALWQSDKQLALIDAEGVVLDRVPVNRMPDLPLLIGQGANHRAEELGRLLDSVPTLKPQLSSATWVGGRRWDLNFQSGETVALPEGVAPARAALFKFAKMDRSAGLLGRGLVRFDLRVPGKMIVRLPRKAGEPIVPPAPPVVES